MFLKIFFLEAQNYIFMFMLSFTSIKIRKIFFIYICQQSLRFGAINPIECSYNCVCTVLVIKDNGVMGNIDFSWHLQRVMLRSMEMSTLKMILHSK